MTLLLKHTFYLLLFLFLSKLHAQSETQVVEKDLTIEGSSLNSDVFKLDLNQKQFFDESLNENYLQDTMSFSKRLTSLLDSEVIIEDLEKTELSRKELPKD